MFLEITDLGRMETKRAERGELGVLVQMRDLEKALYIFRQHRLIKRPVRAYGDRVSD